MGCGGEVKESGNKTQNVAEKNTPKNDGTQNENNSSKNKPKVNNNNNMNDTNQNQNQNLDKQKLNEHKNDSQNDVNNKSNNAINKPVNKDNWNVVVNNVNKNVKDNGIVNKNGDIDTTNFNENDYPIFEKNWKDTNLQNIRFVFLGVINKIIVYDKLFITIDLNKKTAKVVKICIEELGKNKKKHLIQKVHTGINSLEDLIDNVKEYINDYNFMYQDMIGDHNGKDVYLAGQNINNFFRYKFIYYDKKNNYASYNESEGETGDGCCSSWSDESEPEEIVDKFDESIEKYVNIKNQNIKYIDKDKDIDKDNFNGFNPQPFQPFWQKYFYQNFSIHTRSFDFVRREQINLNIF